MAIKINKEACIGCGACATICPDTFKINDVGKAEVIKEENSDCAKNAADSCPTQAISVK